MENKRPEVTRKLVRTKAIRQIGNARHVPTVTGDGVPRHIFVFVFTARACLGEYSFQDLCIWVVTSTPRVEYLRKCTSEAQHYSS